MVEGEEARSVEAAISVLSVSEAAPAVDRHPEKRMKAAYEDFEKVCYPIYLPLFPTSSNRRVLRSRPGFRSASVSGVNVALRNFV